MKTLTSLIIYLSCKTNSRLLNLTSVIIYLSSKTNCRLVKLTSVIIYLSSKTSSTLLRLTSVIIYLSSKTSSRLVRLTSVIIYLSRKTSPSCSKVDFCYNRSSIRRDLRLWVSGCQEQSKFFIVINGLLSYLYYKSWTWRISYIRLI